jgi:hypothetical protein
VINYGFNFSKNTKKLTISAAKGDSTLNDFSIAELRVYGAFIEPPITRGLGSSPVIDPTGFAPGDWIMDNSDPESDNPYAFCDESEFNEVSGCGYLNTYARKTIYNTVYGYVCKYNFKPYNPGGCRYSVLVKWPSPPQGEPIRDFFILLQGTGIYRSRRFHSVFYSERYGILQSGGAIVPGRELRFIERVEADVDR